MTVVLKVDFFKLFIRDFLLIIHMFIIVITANKLLELLLVRSTVPFISIIII